MVNLLLLLLRSANVHLLRRQLVWLLIEDISCTNDGTRCNIPDSVIG